MMMSASITENSPPHQNNATLWALLSLQTWEYPSTKTIHHNWRQLYLMRWNISWTALKSKPVTCAIFPWIHRYRMKHTFGNVSHQYYWKLLFKSVLKSCARLQASFWITVIQTCKYYAITPPPAMVSYILNKNASVWGCSQSLLTHKYSR